MPARQVRGPGSLWLLFQRPLTYHGAMTDAPHTQPPSAPPPVTPATVTDTQLQLHIQHLLVATETLLRRHHRGLSELALIKALQAPPWNLLGTVDFSDPVRLYPVHFLVFHCLYRLRDQLTQQGETVVISPLDIHIDRNPTLAGSDALAPTDSLRAFYLDLDGYRLPEAAINRMVDDFWAGHSARAAPEDLLAAARVLGFETVPERFDRVKYRFRRAVMREHPDRGGATKGIQALNAAFATLRHHFSHRQP